MEKLSKEQINTAMKDPEHLKRWLMESDRRWLVFSTKDLMEALPYPGGQQALAEIISIYRDHRRTIPAGRTEKQKHINEVTSQEVEVEIPVYKDETLEIEELDRVIRYLASIASDKDLKWSIQNTPL